LAPGLSTSLRDLASSLAIHWFFNFMPLYELGDFLS
jgi:hypothetical protein